MISRVTRGWCRYWFEPGPVVNLAVTRIIVVGYQLLHLFRFWILPSLRQKASLPEELYDPLPVIHALVAPIDWLYLPSIEELVAIFWITVAVGVLALVGLLTNVTVGLFAIGNIFLQGFLYSFGDFHHPEAVMMIALVVLALSPSGGALSLDSLWRHLRAVRHRRRFEPVAVLREESAFARWPLRLVGWVFALIYLSGAFFKLERAGLDWVNGYTLQYYLIRDGLRWNLPAGVWLGQHHVLAVVLSSGTLLFEATFFLAVAFPVLLWVYLPVGAATHVGIYYFMGATFLGYLAVYAVFIPWRTALRWASDAVTRRGARSPVVLHAGEEETAVYGLTLLSWLDWLDCLRFRAVDRSGRGADRQHRAGSARGLRVELPDGTVKRGFFAWRAILPYLPSMWLALPVVYFPGAPAAARKLRELRGGFDR